MKKIHITVTTLILFLGLVIIGSCKKDTYELGPDRNFVNMFTGTWKTVQMTQVDVFAIEEGLEPTTMDRTQSFNFTDWTITFNSEGGNPTTYQIDPGQAPNYVDTEGTWTLNDFSYPTTILLTKTGSSEPTSQLAITGPPREGTNSILIRFERYSQGEHLCNYEYICEKQ